MADDLKDGTATLQSLRELSQVQSQPIAEPPPVSGSDLLVGLRKIATTTVNRGTTAPPEVEAALQDAANRHQLDPDLLREIFRQESGFNPRALSKKGAMR